MEDPENMVVAKTLLNVSKEELHAIPVPIHVAVHVWIRAVAKEFAPIMAQVLLILPYVALQDPVFAPYQDKHVFAITTQEETLPFVNV